MHVHEFGKLAQIARQQRVPAFVSQLFGEVQILQHLAGILPSPRILVAENLSRGTRRTGEEHQQTILEIGQSFSSNLQRLRDDMVIRQKLETSNAAECRNVLILLADRFFQ